jgi:hypothetical protein
MEKEGEEKVLELIKDTILPTAWESHLFMADQSGDGKVNDGEKLLLQFKLKVIEGKKDEAKAKLDEFINLLDGTAIQLWERNKENFEQLSKNFDNYFEKLEESLKPSYEEYLNEKKKEEEKRIMESRKEKETKIEVKEEEKNKTSIIERIKSLIKR